MNFLNILFTVVFALFAIGSAAPVPKSDNQVRDLNERGVISGVASFFAVGLGACGAQSQPNDMVLALPTGSYGGGEHCFQNIKVTNTKNGNNGYITVVDECPTCSENQIDLSQGAFSFLNDGNLDAGLCEIQWSL